MFTHISTMQTFSRSTLLTWAASMLLQQPANAHAHAGQARDDHCPSTMERDVIVVGGGSGGT
jgi:hypothetical protein